MKFIETLTYTPNNISFGTSGLRALVSDMTDLECYINTGGFLQFAAEKDNLRPGDTVYLAGDLRSSTPRIMRAVAAAILDGGYTVYNCGFIPIPALAYFALIHHSPGVMVTGSHIPADRNGIKFYKREGEVLKTDEIEIQAAVARIRGRLYNGDAAGSQFSDDGSLKQSPDLPMATTDAHDIFLRRYLDIFAPDSLSGKKIIVYQHSSVARDLLVEVLQGLGADVTPFGRSDEFIPIDTDNITLEHKAQFHQYIAEHPGSFAMISGDGDCDRPIVVDEKGEFHRGDLLGCVTAQFLGAAFAAVPIICNDAVDNFCEEHGITLTKTKVGSSQVLAALLHADANQQPAVGWEMNGGFLTVHPILVGGRELQPLPTRDAFLPILCALQAAVQQRTPLSGVFATLPKRFASQGLIDVTDEEIRKFRIFAGDQAVMQQIAQVLSRDSLGQLQSTDLTDGLRMRYATGEVIHLRPSANAPQFRVYTNADSHDRAQELANEAIAANGYIMQFLQELERLRERSGT